MTKRFVYLAATFLVTGQLLCILTSSYCLANYYAMQKVVITLQQELHSRDTATCSYCGQLFTPQK